MGAGAPAPTQWQTQGGVGGSHMGSSAEAFPARGTSRGQGAGTPTLSSGAHGGQRLSGSLDFYPNPAVRRLRGPSPAKMLFKNAS